LTEDTVEAFAEANKFRRLPDDNVATNPVVRFRVETFEPSEGFQPRKPYQSRLKWRDQDGNEQSKLLLTKPETVIAVVLRGEAVPAPDQQETPSEAPAPFWGRVPLLGSPGGGIAIEAWGMEDGGQNSGARSPPQVTLSTT
jgi:hypothetical protein